jgi:hypothetical protein
VLVAAPAVLIALLGLAHPLFLTPATAVRWQLTHLALLPLFPLLGGSFLWLLRHEHGLAGWVARLAAYGYAVLYGALDAIAGIGAPQQVRHAVRPPIGELYVAGDRLGHLGVVLLAGCALLTGALLWRRHRTWAAPAGAVLIAASCVAFYRHHVFPPRGVLALLGIAVGLVVLGLVQEGVPASPVVTSTDSPSGR